MPDIFVSEEKKSVEKEPKKVENPKNLASHEIEGHTHNPLAAFCYHPDNVKFVYLDREEKVILLLRKHPITNVPWIIIAILMAFAPSVLNYFPLLSFLPERFQLIAILFWYLIVIAFVYEEFLNWFFSVFIVTDERVIDVDFINLIYREISDANIDQIQDVTVKAGGAVRALFNYGNVHIQTAGTVPEIEFEAVPNPDRVAKILRDLRVEEEQEKLEGRVR